MSAKALNSFLLQRLQWFTTPLGVGVLTGVTIILGLLAWQFWSRAPLMAVGLVAATFGAAFFTNPFLGTAAVAFALLSGLSQFIPGLVSPLMAVTLLFVIARKIMAGDVNLTVPYFLRWGILFLVTNLASNLWGESVRFFEWSSLYRVLLICLIVVETVKTRRDFLNLILVVQAAAVLTAVLTIRGAADFYASGIATQLAYTVGHVEEARFFGIWPDANFLALTQIPIIGISIALMRSNELSSSRRWIAMLAMISALIVVMLSMSRGGMLCAFIVIMIMAVADPRRWSILTVFAIVITIVLMIVPIDIAGRLFSLLEPGGDASLSQRTDLLRGGVAMVQDSFPLGFGFGNFLTYSMDYVWSIPWAVYAHNTYLQILVESGLTGLALYIGVIMSVLRAIDWRHRRVDPSNLTRNLNIGVAAGILALLAGMFLLSASVFTVIWFYFSVASLLPIVIQNQKPASEPARLASR